jgi:hypothetical protein
VRLSAYSKPRRDESRRRSDGPLPDLRKLAAFARDTATENSASGCLAEAEHGRGSAPWPPRKSTARHTPTKLRWRCCGTLRPSEDFPLQVLRRRLPDHDRMVGGKFRIWRQGPLEKTLGDFGPDRDVVTCTGKAGTLVFADTAAFYHRGKPASARDRCAIYFNYMNRAPLRPFRCERGTISRAQIRRLAASIPQRQRDCLLWRDSLPLVARIVPPAGLEVGSLEPA